jgi:hypothetical protein
MHDDLIELIEILNDMGSFSAILIAIGIYQLLKNLGKEEKWSINKNLITDQ